MCVAEKVSNQHTAPRTSGSDCAEAKELWTKACDAALLDLYGGGELLSSGDTGARGTYKPVSTAQSQTNTRNRELFAEMSGWLTDAAVLPRPPNTINGRDQAHGGPDDEGDVGLGSAMMGDDDY